MSAILPCSCRPRRPGPLSLPEPKSPVCGQSLASRVLSGPGLWLNRLEEASRRGLIEELLAGGVIEEAVATAPHGHQLDRVLSAKNTLLCVLAGCLFPGEGYDGILRITLGMPGLDVKPGTPVPTDPALSKGRTRAGRAGGRGGPSSWMLPVPTWSWTSDPPGTAWKPPPSTARRRSRSLTST